MENNKHSIYLSDGEGDASQGRKRVRWTSQPPSPRPPSRGSSETGESLNIKTFVAVTGYRGRVGGVYFNQSNTTLYLLEDSTDGSHFDLMRMFLEQTKPDVCLVSSRADEHLILFCQDFMDLAGGQCQVRPHREFVAQKGQTKLQQLRIFSQFPRDGDEHVNNSTTSHAPRNINDFIDSRRDSSGDPNMQGIYAAIRLLNFGGDEAPLCLSAASALLDQLLRIHAAEELDDTLNHMSALNINNIEILALNQVMQINADALASLQIFDDETHASVHSDKTKEGHSLFQLINRTSTQLGQSLLRRWCLRPLLSIQAITDRHAAIECFLLTENIPVAENIQSNLRGLCQVPKAMSLLRTGRGRLAEWRGIAKFGYHVALLKETARNLVGHKDVGAVRQLLKALDGVNAEETGMLINHIIDWEESQNTQSICVNPGIDEILDEKKRTYNGLDDLLVEVAQQVNQTAPEGYTTELNVLYFPQLGYLIRIPERLDGDIEQVPGWTFQFKSEESVYFKSQQMHDLDMHLGDIHSYIVDREIEIIQDLLEQVLKHDKPMMVACEMAAEVDCLLSLASASRLYYWVKPEMTEENILDIKDGIHPLQSLLVSTFVANDARIAGGQGIGVENEDQDKANSIVICTGANACGKSIYLKQNALIPFMAQIGCFVPAQSARLGIVDKIFTRLQTREGVSKLQSAFMIDLSQVSLALRNSTARSLIILDEFGRGSISTDGAGIFAGVLTHLLKRGINCPKVFASTHFHELFTRGLVHPELPISYAYMRVILNHKDTPMEDYQRTANEITYLYKVTSGLCLDSYAARCASMYGLRREIVERAQFVSAILGRNEIGVLLDEELSEAESKRLEEQAEVCQRFISWEMSSEEPVDVRDKLRNVLKL